MALIDDFKARFPEFSTATIDASFPLIADTWDCYYGGDYSQDCDKETILNLLAHLFINETSTSTSSIKGVASKSVGSVSVSYTTSSAQGQNNDFFGTSKYGQRFLMLTRKRSGGFFV